MIGDVVPGIARLIGWPLTAPTMVSVPSVQAALNLATNLLVAYGIQPAVVTGQSSVQERVEAFQYTLDCSRVLIQVRVVSEGVDLPIRRMIDLSPTMSPVKWLQQFGRGTRPGGESEYICTNRNLLRHCYLLDGLVPAEVVAEGQRLFGTSQRSGVRAIGFEGLGKFKTVEVPLANGTIGQMMAICQMENNRRVEYVALCSPLYSEVIYARKESLKEGDTMKWGPWVRIPGIPAVTQGFASVHKGSVTQKQLDWWKKSARRYGLNADVKPNNRQFAALPVLADLGVRLL
jgi:hypothetical protein